MNKHIENIYILSVVVAMGLLFYANADNIESPDGNIVKLGIGKMFYFPCAIALVLSCAIKSKHDDIDTIINLLVAIAFISSIINPPQGSNFLSWGLTRYVMGILCFRKLRYVSPYTIVNYFTLASPLIIFPHYILTNPFGYGPYRYAGFYGDANFLALALNFLIVNCYYGILQNKKIVYKICGISSILGAIPLILVGVSRGGIIGLSVIIIYILYQVLKTNKRLFTVLCIAFLLSFGIITIYLSNTFNFIGMRFANETESDQISTEVRIRGINGALRVLYNKPSLIPFGIGVGNTVATMAYYRTYGYINQADLHSTLFAILYEMGVCGFFAYILLYIKIFIYLRKRKEWLLYLLLWTCVLSLMTLPGAFFMPGWILIFYVSNKCFNSKISHG